MLILSGFWHAKDFNSALESHSEADDLVILGDRSFLRLNGRMKAKQATCGITFRTLITSLLVVVAACVSSQNSFALSDDFIKITAIEKLRSEQVRVCEAEATLYGRDADSKGGLVIEIRACESARVTASLKYYGDGLNTCVTNSSQGKLASFADLKTSVISSIEMSAFHVSQRRVLLESYLMQAEDDLESCRSQAKREKAVTPHESAKLQFKGFEQYVAKFQTDAKDAGHPLQILNLDIHFGNPVEAGCKSSTPISVYGCCTMSPGATPTIVISAGRWALGSEVDHERVINHELGHCILNRGHKRDLDDAFHELSVMFPKIERTSERYYVKHRAEFVSELFRKGGGPINQQTNNSLHYTGSEP